MEIERSWIWTITPLNGMNKVHFYVTGVINLIIMQKSVNISKPHWIYFQFHPPSASSFFLLFSHQKSPLPFPPLLTPPSLPFPHPWYCHPNPPSINSVDCHLSRSHQWVSLFFSFALFSLTLFTMSIVPVIEPILVSRSVSALFSFRVAHEGKTFFFKSSSSSASSFFFCCFFPSCPNQILLSIEDGFKRRRAEECHFRPSFFSTQSTSKSRSLQTHLSWFKWRNNTIEWANRTQMKTAILEWQSWLMKHPISLIFQLNFLFPSTVTKEAGIWGTKVINSK